MPSPIPLSSLLDSAVDICRRYVVLTDHQLDMIALVIAHTYAIDAAHATPYLVVRSAEKRSGKTRLLEVLELLVCRPWRVTSTSEAALFRKLGQDRPTLLLDEVDAIFGRAASERNEALRAILNAGNRPGAAVSRCVGEGSKQSVADFEVFGAKVLAGINNRRLPDTIEDRAVMIEMTRKAPGEQVQRFRHRIAKNEARPIGEALAAWATASVLQALHDAEPDLPGELDDRAAEAVEPLLAIADMAGSDWPRRALAAALTLNGAKEPDNTAGTIALGVIRRTLGTRDKIASDELVTALNDDDEAPFGAWHDGTGINPRGLARLLKPYGISPRVVRTGDGTPRGYRAEQFQDAFRRYLPLDGTSSRNSATDPVAAGDLGQFASATDAPNVADENQRNLSNDGEGGVVADEPAFQGVETPAAGTGDTESPNGKAPPDDENSERESSAPQTDAATRVREQARTVSCCCRSGPAELAEDGRCSRCWGWPREQS